MKKSLLLLFIGISSLFVQGQCIKSLDFSKDYKKNKVTSRTCTEYSYSGYTVTDSIKISEATFDAEGRITKYIEFFARGRKLNEQTFEYNEKGELTKSLVSHAFNDWQPVEMILEFDSSGRLISRTCPIEIRNFWMKEVYHYNAKGKQIKCDQLKQGAQTLEMKSSQEFAPTLHSGENTPMDIHDPNGLLSIHQFYNSSGTVDRVWKYVYSH